MWVGDRQELEPDRLQDLLDAPAELHPVLQRAWRLERNLLRTEIQCDGGCDPRPFGADHFDRVSNEARDPFRALPVPRLLLQQPAVVLDHDTAAARRDDDRLDVAVDVRPPDVDVAADDLERALLAPQVMRQEAPATRPRPP